MSAASVMTLGSALLGLGASVLLLVNLHLMSARVESRLVAVAYLRDGLSPQGVERVLRAARRLGGSARFVSRHEALRRLETALGDVALGDVVRSNPLPDSIEVRPERPAELPRIASALRRIPGVEEVTYGGQAVDRILAATHLVRWLGGGLSLLLGSVAGVVIASTVRLTVLARRSEIEIMDLVGASHALIRAPFLVEGGLQGTCAALLALIVLGPGYAGLAHALARAWPTWPLLPPLEAIPLLAAVLLAGGIGTALLSSAIAVRRCLRT
jgi:cell division transport system permease protein